MVWSNVLQDARRKKRKQVPLLENVEAYVEMGEYEQLWLKKMYEKRGE
jgi:hypothetical protein